MKTYIGTKIVKAEPKLRGEFEYYKMFNNWPESKPYRFDGLKEEGYLVEYEDGYKSWSPKEVFEKHYRELSEDELINQISNSVDDEEAMKNFGSYGDFINGIEATLKFLKVIPRIC